MLVFALRVHPQGMQVKFIYEGHPVGNQDQGHSAKFPIPAIQLAVTVVLRKIEP